jgi:hypothetical protein
MIDKYNLFRISSHLISILNYCVTNQCRPKIKFLDNEGKVLKKKKTSYLFENNNLISTKNVFENNMFLSK